MSARGFVLAPSTASRALGRSTRLNVVAHESRIGKQPVKLPDKVQVTIDGNTIKVKGPNGELERTMPSLVTLAIVDNVIRVSRTKESREANCQHGLVRSLVSNMVEGVSTGWTKTLSMVGVGYRASVAGTTLTLNVGYSHPVEMPIPKGLKVAVEKNTTVVVTGYDKEAVGQFAANIRSKRPPEPYKGKGVRYVDEYVMRKEGKRGK